MPSLWDSLADLARAHRRLLGRAARARGLERVHPRDDDRRPPRGRGDGRGRGRHLYPADHEDFPGSEMLAGTWSLHDYSVGWTSSSSSPRSRRWTRRATTGAGRSRARRSISRCGRRGARLPTSRPRVPAGALRRVDARRASSRTASLPGARVQARRRRGLGSRADGAARRHRPRARPRPEGVLPRHVVDLAPDPELYRLVAECSPAS